MATLGPRNLYPPRFRDLFASAAICYCSKVSDSTFCSVNRDLRRWAPWGEILVRQRAETKPEHMTGKRNRLQEDMHFRVLPLLQDNPEMSQRELAEAVGASVCGKHYVPNTPIEKELVKLENFTAAEDKQQHAYILTPHGIAREPVLTRAFLARKLEVYETLREEIEALNTELGTGGPLNAARKS